MPTPDALFQICGMLAMLGWLCLASTPLWPQKLRESLPRLIGGFCVPAIIASIYTGVILTHWSGHPGNFNSLDGVMQLFTSRWLVVAGWVHYLAFDLFIGGWELTDSRERKIPHLLILPHTVPDVFFGPIGLVSYLLLRLAFRRPSIITNH